jgi:hypothetical protein
MPEIVARWQDWDGIGLEHLVLRNGGKGWLAESAVLGDLDGERFAAQYIVECDSDWRTTEVAVRVVGTGEGVILSSDHAGAWRDTADKPLPSLNGAIDVDITATPFTNTLPIRRLGLEAGQSAEIVVAYIDVPSLTVTADPQRYTCLEPMRRYRFESQGGDFVREIEVDEHGLVVLYPGLFRRVL